MKYIEYDFEPQCDITPWELAKIVKMVIMGFSDSLDGVIKVEWENRDLFAETLGDASRHLKLRVDERLPSWDDAPDWVRWRAQDGNGKWWWYEAEPHVLGKKMGMWWPKSDTRSVPAKEGDPNPNWKDTLEKRPQHKLSDVDAPDGARYFFKHKCGGVVWTNKQPFLSKERKPALPDGAWVSRAPDWLSSYLHQDGCDYWWRPWPLPKHEGGEENVCAGHCLSLESYYARLCDPDKWSVPDVYRREPEEERCQSHALQEQLAELVTACEDLAKESQELVEDVNNTGARWLVLGQCNAVIRRVAKVRFVIDEIAKAQEKE